MQPYSDYICRICDYRAGTVHVAHEKMIGLNDPFNYFECMQCGCLQLMHPPTNYNKYYPSTYYSYTDTSTAQILPFQARIRRRLFRRLNRFYLLGRHSFWKWVPYAQLWPQLRALKLALTAIPIQGLDARILDVGCGSGALLRRMARAGFTQLMGADPFLSSDLIFDSTSSIFALSIHQLQKGLFDVILFNHSLEHVSDQVNTLIAARDRLEENGICVVRTPVAGCDAWREFGTDWVELDAPRHLFIHTARSLQIIAKQAGLQLESIHYDASSFAYWASMLYRNNLSLFDPRTNNPRNPYDHYPQSQLVNWENQAKRANSLNEGSRAIFILKKIK